MFDSAGSAAAAVSSLLFLGGEMTGTAKRCQTDFVTARRSRVIEMLLRFWSRYQSDIKVFVGRTVIKRGLVT